MCGGGGGPERNIEFGDVSSKLNNERTLLVVVVTRLLYLA